jgi:hypothetical protein
MAMYIKGQSHEFKQKTVVTDMTNVQHEHQC